MPRTRSELTAEFTAPGRPFELRVEEVMGRPQKNFRNRQRSLREMVAAVVGFGEREFLVQGERRVTYEEFARLGWGAARSLEARGLRSGDRISVLGTNSIDYVVSVFAAASIGAVVVALNGWWVEEELEYGLRDSGSRLLVVDTRLFARVKGLLDSAPQLEQVLHMGPDAAPEGVTSSSEWIVSHGVAPSMAIEEDAPFVILYTSGTTGRPKGCITTHRGTITQVMGILLFAAVESRLRTGESPIFTDGAQPTVLLTSPLFHVAGIHTGVCTAMTAGVRVVFNQGRFDPEQILSLIERERVTTWSSVPTMVQRVVHCPALAGYDLSSLRSVAFGGAPCPAETRERAREVLPTSPSMTNGYGLTETHGVVMMNAGSDFEKRPDSIGHPAPFFDVRVVDEAGADVADGELGELILAGPTVTPGYWNRPEDTAEAVRDGWLYTGDLATRDPDGFYTIVDRAKDMILRGGENVYCVEIESCLCDHPAVGEAAVVGIPDPELGERVRAIVRLVPGAHASPQDLQAHVSKCLARFKVPEVVKFADRPLPRNPAGKLIKSALRGEGTGVFDDELLD